MKKLLLGLMVASLCVFTLTAGGQRGERKHEISIATHFQADSTEFRAVLEFQKYVEAASNGQIAIATFPGSSLGTEMDNLEQVKTNQVTMAVFGGLLTSQLTPELDPTAIPFAFPNIEEVYAFLNGPAGDRIKAALEERGNQVLIGLQKRGVRYLTASREIRNTADLVGLKLRIPEIPSYVHVWRGLGTLPTPVAFAEVYNALQTRIVDAQENPLSLIWSGKFHEVNRFIMTTEHLYNVYFWGINKDFLNALPADLRQLVLDSAKEACEWGDREVDVRERELADELRRAGAVFVDVDKQAFFNAARPYVESFARELDPVAREALRRIR